MRIRGINYDTGFFDGTRATMEPAVVEREMEVIAGDLGCNAVRVSGGDPERLSVAGARAVDAGLQLWFAPFPTGMTQADLLGYFRDCARRAERLRERAPDTVMVLGCEHTLFAEGFMPGEGVNGRIAHAVEHGTLHAGGGFDSSELNAYLAQLTEVVRGEFGGRITYASGKWEDVDWDLFDIVGVDLYRERAIADRYVEKLRSYRRPDKPFVVLEFGCCTFRGAADQGGTGWMVVDFDVDPPQVREGTVRDEQEQVRYMRELLELYEAEGVDGAFWFTFASYTLPHREDPRFDLDMGAYGVVKMLDGRNGEAYPDLAWEPKASFHALAEIYAGMRERVAAE